MLGISTMEDKEQYKHKTCSFMIKSTTERPSIDSLNATWPWYN